VGHTAADGEVVVHLVDEDHLLGLLLLELPLLALALRPFQGRLLELDGLDEAVDGRVVVAQVEVAGSRQRKVLGEFEDLAVLGSSFGPFLEEGVELTKAVGKGGRVEDVDVLALVLLRGGRRTI
jgi:hypothetical protein